MVRYRHIHLRQLGEAPLFFTARGVPIQDKLPVVDNRPQHAKELSAQLSAATASLEDIIAEQARNHVPPAKRGVLVAVTGREDVRLRTGSARARSPGRKLYSLKRATEPGGQDLATFFLNEGAIETLQRQLESYGQYIDPDPEKEVELDNELEDDAPGKPRGYKFFETAVTIRAATYRDLWTDDVERLPTRRERAEWEVWVRGDLIDPYVSTLISSNIETSRAGTEFVEVFVQNVRATPSRCRPW